MYPTEVSSLVRFIEEMLVENPSACPNICIDSRTVGKDDIFVALPQTRGTRDGGEFINDAIERGSKYIICTIRALAYLDKQEGIEYVPFSPAKLYENLSYLLHSRYDTKTLNFPVVGVTGTNGKTSVSGMLNHVYSSLGKKTGLIGTIKYSWHGHSEEASLTTPDCLRTQEMLAAMKGVGTEIAFMECSSHALDQHRLTGVDFMGAVFTNLSQDHFDYHTDMNDYFESKARLFTELAYRTKVSVINYDDPYGKELYKKGVEFNRKRTIPFGLNEPEEGRISSFLKGEILEQGLMGLHLKMRYGSREWELKSPLLGRFNAENLLAAQALCLGLGLKIEDLASLSKFFGVSGRLERIPNNKKLPILVDYAHTPDALENVLSTIKSLGFSRIITLFGCGGNRDVGKRPLMGAAVAKYSDIAIVTSDNPRHEEPMAIINDILPGIAEPCQVLVEPDRALAIEKALGLMQPRDVLLIAGKGHEQTQQIGDTYYLFSDQEKIKEKLGAL